MNPYNHYPTPDSSNSFYSVKSVIARVSEVISDQASLDALEESLKEFYIPSFSLDIFDNLIYQVFEIQQLLLIRLS